jgi:hypothetical protein
MLPKMSQECHSNIDATSLRYIEGFDDFYFENVKDAKHSHNIDTERRCTSFEHVLGFSLLSRLQREIQLYVGPRRYSLNELDPI